MCPSLCINDNIVMYKISDKLVIMNQSTPFFRTFLNNIVNIDFIEHNVLVLYVPQKVEFKFNNCSYSIFKKIKDFLSL